MAKQGQHKNDRADQRKSRGNRNPSKSMTITTGSYKKQETYEQQAREGKNPDPQPQAQKNEWREDTHETPPYRKPEARRSTRSGSESNASRKTRGH